MKTKPLKLLMKRVSRHLDKYVDLEQSHCGHDELVAAADLERERFMVWLEGEIETRCRSAIADHVQENDRPL